MSLPLTFDPPDPEGAFKHALMDRQGAWFTITYQDGEVEHREWTARRIRRSSYIIGNVRSTFRHWRQAKIASVHVSIEEPEAIKEYYDSLKLDLG